MVAQAPTPFDPGNWGEIVELEQIAKVRVPCLGPDTWRPLPHATYVQMFEQALDRHGFTKSDALHYCGDSRKNERIKDLPQKGRFLSLYGLEHPGLPDIDGVNFEAGLGNSYDMTIAAGAGLGERVSVCSNGLYMGAISGFKRKHTIGIDRDREGMFDHVYELLDNAVGGIIAAAEGRAARIDRFKNTECGNKSARYVIMEAAKRKVIGPAAVLRVLKHWEEPEHPEFKDRNVWSLQNAFTSNDRGQSVFTQANRMGRLDGILDDHFGLSGDFPLNSEPQMVAADF